MRWPDLALLGCCLVSLHFLRGILTTHPVLLRLSNCKCRVPEISATQWSAMKGFNLHVREAGVFAVQGITKQSDLAYSNLMQPNETPPARLIAPERLRKSAINMESCGPRNISCVWKYVVNLHRGEARRPR